MSKINDLFKAYILDDSKLIGREEYPLLEYQFISKIPPKKIIPFNRIKKCKNKKDTYVCFYCADKSFNNLVKNPKRYVKI